MNAWTSDPVASVPMNESILSTTTTKPLMTPTASAAASPSRIDGTMPRSLLTMKCAVTQPDSDITYANDRSKVRADSGTISASAAIAVIA